MSVPPGACCKDTGRGGGASGRAASALEAALTSLVSVLPGSGRVVDEGSINVISACDGRRDG